MKRTSKKGLSLIEVLIAIVLISFLFIAYTLFYGNSISATTANTVQNNAVRLARQAVERIKQYDQLNNLRSASCWNDTSIDVPVNGIKYTVRTQKISTNLNTNISSNNSYIPIRVTVNWTYKNSPNTITVDTCMITTF